MISGSCATAIQEVLVLCWLLDVAISVPSQLGVKHSHTYTTSVGALCQQLLSLLSFLGENVKKKINKKNQFMSLQSIEDHSSCSCALV